MDSTITAVQKQLPVSIIGFIIALCLTPFFLNLMGIDFASVSVAMPAHGGITRDDLYHSLSGAFTHTILEWSAFTVAILTAVLGLVHYKISKDAAIPVVCIALFCAGSMDAFHTLAADRFMTSIADNQNLIPFTWVISRTFNALIIIIGVSLFLVKPDLGKNTSLRLIAIVSLTLIIIAFIIIQLSTASSNLPQTLFPESFISRPWDVLPLVLYIVAGVTVLNRFNELHSSIFAHALLISMIPAIVLELHMSLGSTALFDNDFNIAHFIKIFSYLIPLIGLTIEHIQSYNRMEQTNIALLESEDKATAIFDNAIDGMITMNSVGQILSFNRSAEEIFGYQEYEVINKNVNILMPEPFHSNHNGYLQNYLSTGDKKIIGLNREVSGQHKDGSIFPMELCVSEAETSSGQHLFSGIVRDLSSQITIAEELKYREHLFQTFINAAPVMMWMLDDTNQPLLFNTAWLEFTGRTLAEEKDHVWDSTEIHIDDREEIIDHYNAAFSSQEGFDHEYRLMCGSGNYRWIHELGVPNFDHARNYHGFMGIALDITDSKKSVQDIQNYTKKLERSNEELEQFAYIASHDLQEPLRMVSSYTQLLAKRYKDQLDDDANDFIDFAVDGTARMQRLIQDLLTFSRVSKRSQHLSMIDSNSILANVLKNLQITIDESNTVVSYSDSLPTVMADESQLEQLLQNLIANAIKYRAQDRTCEIDIQCEVINNMWQFSVSDNGIGIDPEYFERIFIIFKRLHGKDEYSGTGIGLAVCKRIAHAHGGDIWVTSEPDQGATFYFTLAKPGL